LLSFFLFCVCASWCLLLIFFPNFWSFLQLLLSYFCFWLLF
jgi:hypothetical protein